MPIYSQRQEEERRNDIDMLWIALGYDDPFFDSQDKDVYTLAVEAIRERTALKEQKLDLEYRLDAQKETNRELCLIDNVGDVLDDLEVTKNSLKFYQDLVKSLLIERDVLVRALAMVRRISRLMGTPWFYPLKTIDKLATSILDGEIHA